MAMVKIVKLGNSQDVRLPRYLLDSAKLSDNDAIEITTSEGSILIRKAINRKHRTLKERLAEYNGDYHFEEWDTGVSVGKERFWEDGSGDGVSDNKYRQRYTNTRKA